MKIFLAIIVITLQVTLLWGQQVQISLTSDQSTNSVGDPVIVYVTVTNNDQQPVSISTLFGPEYQIYSYSIQFQGKAVERYVPYMIKETEGPNVTLQKGQSVSGSARIFFGAHGYTFPAPGTYTVTCSLSSVQSQPLTLTFTEPSSDAAKNFSDAMLHHGEFGLFLMMEGGDELTDGIRRLDEIVRKFPGTPYAGIAGYALGRNYSRPAMNFVSKSPRAADIAKATAYLEAARDVKIGAHYVRNTYAALRDLYMKSKNTAAISRIDLEVRDRLNSLGTPGKNMLEELDRREKLKNK